MFKRHVCVFRLLINALQFLSDPSPIMSVTDSCLIDLTDVTLAFEDANSKFIDVFTVADVDAEERVNDSLVEILKRTFEGF